MLFGAKGLTGDENILKRCSKMWMQPVPAGQPESADAMPLVNQITDLLTWHILFVRKKLQFTTKLRLSQRLWNLVARNRLLLYSPLNLQPYLLFF